MSLLYRPIFVCSLICFRLADSIFGAELPSGTAQRIATVERSLIPATQSQDGSPHTIAERLRDIRVPGLSVAVITQYRIEWAKGYGLADVADERPVTIKTLFQAGSVSKPVAALAALRLVEQGVLDLDGDVNRWLKAWKVPENEFTRQHPVELRGLLSHTAGLSVQGFSGYAVGTSLPTVPQILDGSKPANSAPVRVVRTPGRDYRYSGGGTTVMQQLLVDVTGRPFPNLLHDTVLRPLEMTSSTYQQPLPHELESTAATGYRPSGKAVSGRWHVYPEMAAAGLWSTPSDLARYVIEIQLTHEGKSQKVLSQNMVKQMLTKQAEGADGPIGLGPFVHEVGSSRYFEHDGGDDGFVCKFVGYLDRGQGAVVMTNSDTGGQLVREVLNAIAEVYGWPSWPGSENTCQ